MNVYTVRYEDICAYSTARKAIEAVCWGKAIWFTASIHAPNGLMHEIDMENKTEKDVVKLISVLNKQGFLTVEVFSNEHIHLDKLVVR